MCIDAVSYTHLDVYKRQGYNTKAIFTFTGTGFDILARTTTETAGIVYSIEKYDSSTGKYSFFRMGAVDTYYINGALYQLPVIHEEGMAHGTYRVTLGIKQTGNLLTVSYTHLDVYKRQVSANRCRGQKSGRYVPRNIYFI